MTGRAPEELMPEADAEDGNAAGAESQEALGEIVHPGLGRGQRERRPGDDDANGVEEFLSLRSGLRFNFVDDGLELLGGERRTFGHAFREGFDHCGSFWRRQDFGIVGSGERGCRIVGEDESGAFGKLLEAVDRRSEEFKAPTVPLSNRIFGIGW